MNREPMAKPMKTRAPTENSEGENHNTYMSVSVTQESDHPHWDFLGNESATDDSQPSADDVTKNSSKTDPGHVIDPGHHYGGQLGPEGWGNKKKVFLFLISDVYSEFQYVI